VTPVTNKKINFCNECNQRNQVTSDTSNQLVGYRKPELVTRWLQDFDLVTNNNANRYKHLQAKMGSWLHWLQKCLRARDI